MVKTPQQRRQGAAQCVIVEPQLRQVRQCRELLWDGARQEVAVQGPACNKGLGLGFRIFRVYGLGFTVWGLRFTDYGSGFLGFRVYGLGFTV
jgi:hypothetical protein